MSQTPSNNLNGAIEDSSENNDDEYRKFTKRQIIKNLVIVSVGCLLAFTAYDGLVMLQSTINQAEGIGVLSVAIQFSFSCITAILLPEYLFEKIGCKAVIAICLVLFVPYIASNFHPVWELMIPSSILIGLANSLYWAAQSAYLNQLSILYTDQLKFDASDKVRYTKEASNGKSCAEDNHDCSVTHKDTKILNKTPIDNGAYEISQNDIHLNSTDKEKGLTRNIVLTGGDASNGSSNSVIETVTKINCPISEYVGRPSKLLESTTARFFGIHGLIYQTCHVWSNLMSYYVLRIGAVKEVDFKNSTCKCGADFCTVDTDCSKNNLREPRDDLRNLLTGLFVALSVLSVLLVVFGLDELKKKKKNVAISWEYLIATCKHIKNKKQLFLIPMSLNIGVSQGFVMGDFTKDFVGCAWGVHNVGLVTACLGATLSLSSSFSGWFVKYLGRRTIFLIAKALNIAVIVIMLLWKPDPSQSYMFFIISGILGAVLGTFWSQLRAFYGVLFKDKEGAAFANYQLWHAIGMAMAFAYSNYICTSMKIYIYIAFSTFGMIGYLLAERSHSLENK
ncbi:protein unc-93 homolog A [Caerostris darwini]|uniref:Protein unc-93 homolog A n=1 Tax=Caerostris darwini TaxID=1538125 RepID=A0AAV4X938_9ARAC|nr:protein unc-93 homolog A [Caerostris darwini]